jgi:hypothetical protein
MITIKNKDNFTDLFLLKFLENGFGATPKRELEIYILHLLLQDSQFDNNGVIDYHQISLALKITETKVRNLIYEVELKYGNNLDFVNSLIEIIENGKYDVDEGKIKFSVQNPLVKQAFEFEIRQLNGVSDGSFAKHIVTIKKVTFEKLLLRLYGDSTRANAIIDLLPMELKSIISDKESLIKEFVSEFSKKFAGTAGDRTAHLLFDSIDPVSFIKRLLGRD